MKILKNRENTHETHCFLRFGGILTTFESLENETIWGKEKSDAVKIMLVDAQSLLSCHCTLLAMGALANQRSVGHPARSAATIAGGGCCSWVTTLKACFAILALLAASTCWSPVLAGGSGLGQPTS